MKMRFIAAIVLAIMLATGTQTNLKASDGYGTGNCSAWASFWSLVYGVDCHYLMAR